MASGGALGNEPPDNFRVGRNICLQSQGEGPRPLLLEWRKWVGPGNIGLFGGGWPLFQPRNSARSSVLPQRRAYSWEFLSLSAGFRAQSDGPLYVA